MPAGRAAMRAIWSIPTWAESRTRVTGQIGCDGVTAPAATFQAHVAPLGIAFWDGDAVIAFHGSWNRSREGRLRGLAAALG